MNEYSCNRLGEWCAAETKLSKYVVIVNMAVIPTVKPTTVINTDEPTTVKDTAKSAVLRTNFYSYILSSRYNHKTLNYIGNSPH